MEAERFLLAQGISLSRDIVETTSIGFGRSYLLCSDSIWFAPRGAAEPDIENGSIALLPLATGSMDGPVGITVRADAMPAPSAALMMQSIRDTVMQRHAAITERA